MRIALAGLLLAFWMLAWPLPSARAATPIGAIVGAAVVCDTTNAGCLPFPTQAAILCNGSGAILDCPQFFHPDWTQSPGSRFYGVTNRVNPPRYIQSTDGGTTWTLTPTQPFGAAVLNFGGRVAVTSDGSIIAASGQGANLCIIRKSIDQGATWADKFTSVTRNCSIQFASPTPPGIYCTEIPAGYCALIDMTSGVSIDMVFSTDNGETWTDGVNFGYISADSQAWGPIVASDGAGIFTRGVNSSGGQPFGTKGVSDFSATLNYVPAANQNCRPLVMGTAKRAVCRPSGAGGLPYRYLSGGDAGIAPAEINTFTPADTPAVGVVEQHVGGFDSIHGYMVQVSIAIPNRYNIYITGDSWASVSFTQQLIPTTAPVGACCRGNFMRWGSKMYWSTGSSGATAVFVVIQ